MNQSFPRDAEVAALPLIIQRYLQAHDERDTDTTLRTFRTTAEVIDEGETRRGHDQIRRWLDTASSEYTYERTLIDVSTDDNGHWVVRNNLTGNFPGGTVDLAYRFALHDDLIDRLVIAPVAAEASTEHG